MLLPLGRVHGLHRAEGGGVGRGVTHAENSARRSPPRAGLIHRLNVFTVSDPCPVSLRSELEPIKLELWYNPITPPPPPQISRLGLDISEWQLPEAEVGSGFVGSHLTLVVRAGSGYQGPGRVNAGPKIQLFDGLMELRSEGSVCPGQDP